MARSKSTSESSSRPLENKSGYLRVDVAGEDRTIWQETLQEFIDALRRISSYPINEAKGTTIADEWKSYLSTATEAGKEWLRKHAVSNAELESLIVKNLSDADEARARAEKHRTETRGLEIENCRRELEFLLEKFSALVEIQAIALGGSEKEVAVVIQRKIRGLLLSYETTRQQKRKHR